LYNVHHTSTLPVVYDQLQCSVSARSLDDCNVTLTRPTSDNVSCDADTEAAAVSCIPHLSQTHNGNTATVSSFVSHSSPFLVPLPFLFLSPFHPFPFHPFPFILSSSFPLPRNLARVRRTAVRCP